MPLAMHDILCFHPYHGAAVCLEEDGRLARRLEDRPPGQAVVFTSRPLKPSQRVCVQLTQAATPHRHHGVLRLGVTTCDPATLCQSPIRYACPDLQQKDAFWISQVDPSQVFSGCRITVYLSGQGRLHYLINQQPKGCLLTNVPTDKQIWLLIDLYGNTVCAKLISPDEVPVDLLARGPKAVQTYQQACQSGTQPVFRTRLMLVGRDGVGKTSLKKVFMGERPDTEEEKTGGIDLSASCSFNLQERTAWQQIISQPPGQQHLSPSQEVHQDEKVEIYKESEEEMVASNIIQEILFVQYYQNKDQGAICLDKLKSHPLLRDKPSKLVQQVMKMMKKHLSVTDHTKICHPQQQQQAFSCNSNITLNIWDFAGQSVYYTTHQVFLSSRAVYVMVFSFSQALETSRSDITESHLPPKYEEDHSELSNLDYMDYWMNSIHAHTARNTRESVDNTTLSPRIFIVGTHRNSLHSDPQLQAKAAEEQFDQIRALITGKPYELHMVPYYYSIENDMDDPEIERLRHHIEEVASLETYMGEQMPTRWLRLEQAIQKLVGQGINFSLLHQLQEVAKEEGVNEQELETFLHFYHDLGVVVYYGVGSGALDPTLHNTVILNPQWLVDMFSRLIHPHHKVSSNNMPLAHQGIEELWRRLSLTGVLEERLLDEVWHDALSQKHVLLALMRKLDLLCERVPNSTLPGGQAGKFCRSFYVPACMGCNSQSLTPYIPSARDVSFFVDFYNFLPEGLFHRLLTRAVSWSQDCGGHEPQLAFRKARFFLDPEHDFLMELSPRKLARLKVTVQRMELLYDSEEDSTDSIGGEKSMPPPHSSACAKVRTFLEHALSELKELWMKRLAYQMSVACSCDKICERHECAHCTDQYCVHLLNLDHCLTNKVVCCGHRRVKTNTYRKWFPSMSSSVTSGPVLPEIVVQRTDETYGNIELHQGAELPSWSKRAAKLLNGGPDGQDWVALANKLGYKKNRIDRMNEDMNPALALITDWIVTSGNTRLSVDMLTTNLEQMLCDDIVEIITDGQEYDGPTAPVFISYQWDIQDEVQGLRDSLERAHLPCWMDIGQMGGGDQLYTRIDQAIRASKVVIACVTPKYVVSHHCNRELSLADLLRKTIIPVMYDKVVWPPPGGMALIFSQLCYINMKGIGGHGGAGIHADLEQKYQEIVQRVSCHTAPHRHHTVTQQPPQLSIVPNPSLLPHSSPRSTSSHSYSSSPDNMLIPGYSSDFTLPPTSSAGGSITAGRRNTAVTPAHGAAAPPSTQSVHVTRCAVCTIL